MALLDRELVHADDLQALQALQATRPELPLQVGLVPLPDRLPVELVVPRHVRHRGHLAQPGHRLPQPAGDPHVRAEPAQQRHARTAVRTGHPDPRTDNNRAVHKYRQVADPALLHVMDGPAGPQAATVPALPLRLDRQAHDAPGQAWMDLGGTRLHVAPFRAGEIHRCWATAALLPVCCGVTTN